MKPNLGPYKLGLAVIGVFTLGLVGYVLAQASTTKQDTQTYEAATKIATQLSDYISSKQTIPNSLTEAGVGTVPPTITYTKLSGSKYTFCVKYKAASSNFDATSAISDAVVGNYGKYSSFDSSSSRDASSSYLDISSSHKKGSNCQTVEPYIFGADSSSSSSDYSNYFDSFNSVGTLSSDRNAAAADTERQTDLRTLQAQLEAYYATNGSYPALADLNSTTWRAANMAGMDEESLKDPSGTSYVYALSATPGSGHYSYQVSGSGGSACTSSTCQSYVLTATLSTGKTYTVNSLN